MTSKSELLGLIDSPVVAPVKYPEPYNGGGFVRVMDGICLDRFDDALDKHRQGKAPFGIMAPLACFTLCEENGTRLFRDDEVAQVAKLPAPILTAIWDKALEINRRRKADGEELKGNSEGVQNDGSGLN